MKSTQTSYAELAMVLERMPLLAREARRSRGLSLRAAAKDMGLNFSTLNRFERGEDVVLSNAVTIMRWLDQTWREA